MELNRVYKIKATAISPIHIGTSQEYIPTNFIIEDNKLYRFNEEDLLSKLKPNELNEYFKIYDSDNKIQNLYKFFYRYKNIAKDISFEIIEVSKKLSIKFQFEMENFSHRMSIFNQFIIEPTIKNGKNIAYIPGSSLKGAISTAIQEAIYKKDKKLYKKVPKDSAFKNLSISDTKNNNTTTKIAFSANRHRFKDREQNIYKIIEAIKPNSTFEFDITIKNFNTDKEFAINQIIDDCNRHYYENFESMFFDKNLCNGVYLEDFIKNYFSDSFYNDYIDFKPNDKQFLIRVGKHSGARAVTIEGKREIKVKTRRGFQKREEETTTWLFGDDEKGEIDLDPFGWLICEVV